MHIKDVPIFYYHSVSDDSAHPWSFQSLRTEVFEKQLRYLSINGFKTFTISELYEMKKGGIPDKTVVLTFDDGYLDNWVYAYPFLKKYGIKATFFINPEFVDPYQGVRPTLADVWNGTVSKDGLTTWGYASWNELREMSREGSVDIQSHGMTHTWYFSGDKIVDFHNPGDPYYWLKWNLYPEKKPFWLADDFDDSMSYGYPVYEFKMGLLTRRYFDDPNLAKYLTSYVKKNGGRDFFHRADWKNELSSVCYKYMNDNPVKGRLETEEEYLTRVRYELEESQQEIEKQLGKDVRFISWPNGGYDERIHKLAIENAGYLATVGSVRSPLPYRDNLLGRVSYGQGYRGPLRDFLHYMKFISVVESMSGTGIRHKLIRMYQKTKISSCYHWFLRNFFEWR
jgi:peptidoglycan/xylan/chitin deacetylase (PgdA/CDA1 family)